MEKVIEKIRETVIQGNGEEMSQLIRSALEAGMPAGRILSGGLIDAMHVVGRHMKSGEMFIPEVLLSARTMQKGVEMLSPCLSDSEPAQEGVIVIGTVEGDLHDIGKNLVSLMLQGAGFKVIDLGINVMPSAFVEAVRIHKPQVLGMSALLTTTVMKMKETLIALETAGVRDQVKVMAGGAPVTQNLVEDFGADGYGSSAPIAVDLARKFVESPS